jgi:glucose-1-phosphate adenylyltransferase
MRTISQASVPKASQKRHSMEMKNVLTLIMAGGRGTRMQPLTNFRCKPALPYGGRYRLIDFPISNAINSGCRSIALLTQFLSRSLNSHLMRAYPFAEASSATIEVLSAEEKLHDCSWFQGTADAVRHHLDYLIDSQAEYFLILSGDQLYNFDFRQMVQFAQETESEVVVACLPVVESEAKRMGVVQLDEGCNIISFHEKPGLKKDLNRLRRKAPDDHCFIASMGIYLFRRNALIKLLQEDLREDFGKHLIPTQVAKGGIAAYIYRGYWEDIGTMSSFYDANMRLLEQSPFDFFDRNWQIYTRMPLMPAARIDQATIESSIICEGSHIAADQIKKCIIGPRIKIGKGSILSDSYLLGGSEGQITEIGEEVLIRKAIIDEGVQIGNRVQLINKNKLLNYDSENIYVRDGIIVIAKGAMIPEGFVF